MIKVKTVILLLFIAISQQDNRFTKTIEKLKQMCKIIPKEEAIILTDIDPKKDLVKYNKSMDDKDEYFPIAKGGYGFIYINYKTKKVKKIAKQKRLEKSSSLRTLTNEIELGKDLTKMGHPMLIRDCELILNNTGNKVEYLAMLMDYKRGRDLKKHIESKKREYSKDDCEQEISFAIVILKQLKSMHESGMMHRDIKPANIYLEQDDEGFYDKLWIIDFGFASYKETDKVFKGTDSHVAPEVIQRIQYDKRIDAYSTGMSLMDLFEYYLLEDAVDSACNNTSLFLILNQMLQYYYKPDNCNEFDSTNVVFENKCRLTISQALDLLKDFSRYHFDEEEVENPNNKEFFENNNQRIDLEVFENNDFFSWLYLIDLGEVGKRLSENGFFSYTSE